jgi:hypothetical protein
MLYGDGSITARVDSLDSKQPWAGAAVMIRESLSASSAHAMAVVTPSNGVAFEYRPSTGGRTEQADGKAGIAAPYWLRLTRSSNTLTARGRSDATAWEMLGTVNISMPTNVRIGLAVTSHDVNAPCTAEFSGVTLTGSFTGAWQAQDVGIGNAPEPLYVSLWDAANENAVVPHDDPAATIISTWTRWDIPLTSFTEVNLRAIKKLSVGIGDRANSTHASEGDLYVDDIRLYLAQPGQ